MCAEMRHLVKQCNFAACWRVLLVAVLLGGSLGFGTEPMFQCYGIELVGHKAAALRVLQSSFLDWTVKDRARCYRGQQCAGDWTNHHPKPSRLPTTVRKRASERDGERENGPRMRTALQASGNARKWSSEIIDFKMSCRREKSRGKSERCRT